MGLHSSAGRVLQRELRFNCDGHIFISYSVLLWRHAGGELLYSSITMLMSMHVARYYKRAVSPIFSNSAKSQKTHVHRWKSENNGPLLSKLIFHRTAEKLLISVSGCEWPGWKWTPT